MKLPSRITAATGSRFKRVAAKIDAHPKLDFLPRIEQKVTPERIAQKSKMMAIGGTRPSRTEYERMMGTNDLVDEFFLVRALLVARPVARLSIRSDSGGERGCATGFMVSPRLLMTNQHVFSRSDEAEFSFAEFNFRDDVGGYPEPSFRYRLRPDKFFYTHRDLDFALVSVDPEPLEEGPPLTSWGWLRLIAESGKAHAKDWLTIVQHPGGSRRQFAIRENQCIDDEDENFLWYLSDTAQGSSGAPVFNDSMQIAALHHSGRARQENGKYILRNGEQVDSLEDVDESLVDWVANEGVRISQICSTLFREAREKDTHLSELRDAMRAGDILSRAYKTPQSAEIMNIPPANQPAAAGAIVVPVTLDLRLSLFGQPLGPTTTRVAVPPPHLAPVDGAGEVEAYKKPIIDENYDNRTGFDESFLGISTPLPELNDDSIAARMLESDEVVVPYEHFSVVMHQERRMAIYTAANVDWSRKARRPEPGRNYTRDGLGGFSENDVEQWVPEPRLDDAHQVPDVFYKRDANSFDKGHLVRRDDVCWGADYAQVRRANGDTYHMTNCSPQIAGFNRAPQGLWGLLENLVQAQGATERYNVFAGPVLADDDRYFDGKGPRGANLRLLIPDEFWKVVVSVRNGQLEAHALLLQQDLSDVPPGAEFVLTGEWVHRMTSIPALEEKIGLFRFPQELRDADAFAG